MRDDDKSFIYELFGGYNKLDCSYFEVPFESALKMTLLTCAIIICPLIIIISSQF